MKDWINKIIEHWKGFFQFVKSPSKCLEKKAWSYSDFALARITCIFLMIIGFICQIIFSGIIQIDKTITHEKDVFVLPNVLILITGGFLAPMFEELAFRLPLKLSLKNIFIALIASLIMFIFFNKLSIVTLYNTQYINFSINQLIIPTFLLITILTFKTVLRFGYNSFWYGIFVWILAILFAISHGYNDIYSIKSFTYILLSTVPQLLGGLYYSFLRMKFGIYSSILIHSYWNTFLIILKIIFENNSI
jgi:hypothetical protein